MRYVAFYIGNFVVETKASNMFKPETANTESA